MSDDTGNSAAFGGDHLEMPPSAVLSSHNCKCANDMLSFRGRRCSVLIAAVQLHAFLWFQVYESHS